jgi:hypothetical protein
MCGLFAGAHMSCVWVTLQDVHRFESPSLAVIEHCLFAESQCSLIYDYDDIMMMINCFTL